MTRNLEDLSDMSENDDFSSGSDDNDLRASRRRNKRPLHMQLSDSGCQTDMVDALASPVSVSMSTKSVTAPLSPQVQPPLSDKTAVHEDSDSSDSVNPKFDMRPADLEVAAGDPAVFKCRVSGTQPIGQLPVTPCW